MFCAAACGGEAGTRSSIAPVSSTDGGAGSSQPAAIPIAPHTSTSTTDPAGCAAPIACPGTTSGPWCVEHFPIDSRLFPTFTGVWSDAPDDTWIVGTLAPAPGVSGVVGMQFTWNGCAWTHALLPSPLQGLFDIWGSGPNNVWAVGDHGTAINWDGKYWSSAPVGEDVMLRSVSGTGPGDVWTSFGFHWNGGSWTPTTGGQPGLDVWAVSPTDVWATDGGANVAHFDGSGWTTMRAGDFAAFGLFAIWGGPGVAWAVGEGNQITHFSGGAWTQVQPPSGSSQGMVDVMAAGSDVYAVGQGILHSVGGGPFVMDPDAPQEGYLGLWISPTQVWAVGRDGTVIHRAR
jgi:hypothetical protein